MQMHAHGVKPSFHRIPLHMQEDFPVHAGEKFHLHGQETPITRMESSSLG